MRVSLRLSLFCAAIFAALGAFAPFWPVWLETRGLGEGEIALLISTPAWIRVIGAPLLSRHADQSGRRRRLARILSWLSLFAFAAFFAAPSFAWLLLVTALFGTAFMTLVPLSDQSILTSAREHGIEYGRVRLWGSLAFLVLAFGTGVLVDRFSADAVFWTVLALLLLTAAASHALPPFDRTGAPGEARASVREALRVPGLLRVLTVYGLVMGSHAVLMTFSTIHWRGAGIRDSITGLLWAEGVVAEIVLLALGARVARGLGARGLLLLGSAAAVVRWGGTAATTWLPALFALQAGHALTFGACHLGAMEWIARRAPDRLSTTALGLCAAISGLFTAALTLLSGPLYERFSGGAFAAMMIPAAVGVALLAKPLEDPEETRGRGEIGTRPEHGHARKRRTPTP